MDVRLIYEARNVETRILSRRGILPSYEECFPDKVGPDSSYNKVVTQARFPKVFWLAEPALKFYEERSGLLTKLKGDSAGVEIEIFQIMKEQWPR